MTDRLDAGGAPGHDDGGGWDDGFGDPVIDATPAGVAAEPHDAAAAGFVPPEHGEPEPEAREPSGRSSIKRALPLIVVAIAAVSAGAFFVPKMLAMSRPHAEKQPVVAFGAGMAPPAPSADADGLLAQKQPPVPSLLGTAPTPPAVSASVPPGNPPAPPMPAASSQASLATNAAAASIGAAAMPAAVGPAAIARPGMLTTMAPEAQPVVPAAAEPAPSAEVLALRSRVGELTARIALLEAELRKARQGIRRSGRAPSHRIVVHRAAPQRLAARRVEPRPAPAHPLSVATASPQRILPGYAVRATYPQSGAGGDVRAWIMTPSRQLISVQVGSMIGTARVTSIDVNALRVQTTVGVIGPFFER